MMRVYTYNLSHILYFLLMNPPDFLLNSSPKVLGLMFARNRPHVSGKHIYVCHIHKSSNSVPYKLYF